MNAARFVSFWTGFCSLSLEIAWVRLYGYANQSTPLAFSYVLLIYLLGIALGAQFGKKICQISERQRVERYVVVTLVACALIVVFAPWAYLASVKYALDDLLAPLAIFSTAASFSVIFPIAHHLGTPQRIGENFGGKGAHFSRVYIMNILGAASGPLVTGYFLFEKLTITQVFPVLAFLVAVMAFVLYLFFYRIHCWKISAALFVSFLSVFYFLYFSFNNPESLAEKFAIANGRDIVAMRENRHGIIALAADSSSSGVPSNDYVVYGGNVYDGRTNVDLERNTNGLERPLALHVLQPNAKRVLVLGLSIGSWLTVVEAFPGVEEIDVVEINPGYIDLANGLEPQRTALTSPKVRLHIDDGRRWLRFNSSKRYDIILMNATWHWRANSSMLLSRQMMEIVNDHLAEHGIFAFNATGSVDAFYTAATVFENVRRYQNFIYSANWDPFTPVEKGANWDVLREIKINGKPGFSVNSKKIEMYSKIPFVKLDADISMLGRSPEVITDDNMLVEYKYGRKF